ncbi:thioredoxin domain-containing protein [Streptomyces sp. NPDC056149]|uniref:thioredoxin domain-containing protein n=1 Tax=unclassified Streptomyces TaxID=2593676 RepID=UPI0023814808|nr:thioredoxin domain-containing protein [Streptomyces sp. WZ-12]
MSNRNSQANKQAARERLRAERERQAKKDRTRRQLIVGGAVVAVLAVAGGIGLAVANSGGGSSSGSGADVWAKAAKAKPVPPAHTSGPDGTTITVGKADAKNTLELFEDPRCPGCSVFEQTVGSTIEKDINDGKYKATYHIGTFLDNNLQGTGSKNALSALGAALNVSPDAFLKYKFALYSKEYHPDETGPDKFADDSYLLKVANTIPALKGNAAFEKAVKDGTYNAWAMAMSKNFDSHKDVRSTPTVKMNGTVLGTQSAQGPVAPSSVADFNAQVDKNLKK